MTTPVRAPESLDEALSPAWLSAALGTRFPGVVVSAVEPGPVDARVSTNARFRVTYSGAVPAELPRELCLKAYFGPAGRAARSVGVVEARYYRDLAARAGTRTLRALYAEVDEEQGQGVVLSADVVSAGGSFADPAVPSPPDRVAGGLTELARLHAATWEQPAWAQVPWLAPRLHQLAHAARSGVVHRTLDGELARDVPAPVRDPERLLLAYGRVAEQLAGLDRWTVMHGDAHLGNTFDDAQGRAGFLDWQLVQRGAWYVDVGYYVASALSVEDRRHGEDDLLRHYLDGLSAAGVVPPGVDEARHAVQTGVVHGLYLWSITQQVAPAVTTSVLERLGTAAHDHDAIGAVLAAAA